MGQCCGTSKARDSVHRGYGGGAVGYNQGYGGGQQLGYGGGGGGQRLGSQGQPPQFAGPGYALGANGAGSDVSPEERRALALSAAEARQQQNATKGGISKKKAKELDERAMRDELRGKIENWCKMHKEEVPLGLGMASIQQLKDTWARLTAGRN